MMPQVLNGAEKIAVQSEIVGTQASAAPQVHFQEILMEGPMADENR